MRRLLLAAGQRHALCEHLPGDKWNCQGLNSDADSSRIVHAVPLKAVLWIARVTLPKPIGPPREAHFIVCTRTLHSHDGRKPKNTRVTKSQEAMATSHIAQYNRSSHMPLRVLATLYSLLPRFPCKHVLVALCFVTHNKIVKEERVEPMQDRSDAQKISSRSSSLQEIKLTKKAVF